MSGFSIGWLAKIIKKFSKINRIPDREKTIECGTDDLARKLEKKGHRQYQ